MNRAEQWVKMIQADAPDGSIADQLCTNFEYLLEHVEEWEGGKVSAGDLPEFDQSGQAVVIYSVLFGTLWELAHPSIYAVMDGERLIGLYGHETNAEERASELGCRVQRMSVTDGDEDPETVLDMEGVA